LYTQTKLLEAKMPRLHLIGNAHLDPVWLWRWQEGFAEIKATFRSALDRMQEFPEFTFTCAGASYYQWVEHNEPEMFAQIRQRVAEGRWILAGGWWLQPDCNLPSGESFARHALSVTSLRSLGALPAPATTWIPSATMRCCRSCCASAAWKIM
jgi:alpha-mannosidase